MDKKLIESYLDNIAESVVDEDKIVTYKSLSKSLGIHVNTAKQLLHTYLAQQKAQNAFPISATYLLAGKLVDGSFNITIINESELKSTYPKFIEITSEHVYSIQKGKNIREVNMLCGVDKGTQESTCLVITSSKCVLRSKDEVKKKPESTKQVNEAAIKKAFGGEQENVCPKESEKKVGSPVKKEIIKSPKKTSPKKNKEKNQPNVKKSGGIIANMFAKAAQKNAEKPKNVKNEEKESRVFISDDEVVGKSAKSKNMPNTCTKTDQKNEEKIKNSPEIQEKNYSSSEDEEFEVVRSKKSKSISKATPKKTKGNKRKRIWMGSDSSDSENNDGEPPQTPVEKEDSESLPVPPLEDNAHTTESQPLNKRKKRKIVDKMVMHEDGYLETKKEVVFETDSDDTEEEQKKDKSTKPLAKFKPAAANAAKKQSSLLTFFKKS